MLKAYGEQAGFDWQLNEIIGAQVVSVPMAVPMQRAKTTFYTSIGALVAISFAMFVDAARKCRTTVQFYLRLVAQVDDLDLKVQLSKHAAAEAAARSAPKS